VTQTRTLNCLYEPLAPVLGALVQLLKCYTTQSIVTGILKVFYQFTDNQLDNFDNDNHTKAFTEFCTEVSKYLSCNPIYYTVD